MATTDIRFKRINDEYQCVRNAQTDLFGKVDTVEAAILGLTEAVNRNSEQIAENRQLIIENRERIDDISAKLDAIIAHLDVPYKPPAGFLKE